MATFKHSGDLGDIVYSLPAIRALGGGVLYLDLSGGADEPICRKQLVDGRTKLARPGFDFLAPLLRAQRGIEAVEVWSGEAVDYNLNRFREKVAERNALGKTRNLLELHLDAFGLPPHDPNQAWLDCGEPVRLAKKLVVCRSPRYQTNYPWFVVRKFTLRDRAVFVGLPKEHEIFEYTFDIAIEYVPTPDALRMAQVIAGCETFIANATFGLALAIGLGHRSIVHEFEPRLPTTHFEGRQGITYV
jgi:hypothetical protein